MNGPEVDIAIGSTAPVPQDSRPSDNSDIPFSELVTITVIVFVAIITVLLLVFPFRQQSNEQEGQASGPLQPRVVREELPLGEYKCMTSTPSDGSQDSLQIVEFEAAAVVHGTGFELLQMSDRLRYYSARIGQQLDQVARSATPEELADPSLKVLRQRMKSRVNRIFGAELIEDVIFSRFRTFEIPNPD